MERLCISSFLQNGHPFHLYVYHDTEGIPPGTVVRNGEDILPATALFTYRDHATFAGFANFFRYKLLLEKGGWFVDLDTICLRPFRLAAEYVFSSERAEGGRESRVNLAAMKSPPGTPLLHDTWRTCEGFDPNQLSWGQCGPLLISQKVAEHKMGQYILPPDTFSPVDHQEWNRVLAPGTLWAAQSTEPFAVHLWNERWRRAGQDKDAEYDPDCLYEQLKRRYLKEEKGTLSTYAALLHEGCKYRDQLPPKIEAGLTILMLSHNRPDRTADAIRCLFDQVTIPFRLLLIDNSSDRATCLALRDLIARYPSIELIFLEENLGCAAGRMFGVDRVHTEFVMLLDNDINVLPGAVEHLVLALQSHPEAVASTGRVVLADGRVHVSGGKFLREGGIVQAELLDFGRSKDEVPAPSCICDWVPGCMTVVRSAELQRHRYDPKLNLYYEDLEWCLRLKNQDPAVVFLRCVEALGVHYHEPKQPVASLPESERIARSMPYLETMAYLYGALKLLVPGIFAFLPELGGPSTRGAAAARLLLELLSLKGRDWFARAWSANDLRPLLSDDQAGRRWEEREEAIRFLQQENEALRASLQNREEAVEFLLQENAIARAK